MRTRNDPEHLEYMRRYGVTRRVEREAAGLCVRCGGPRDSARKSCGACLAGVRQYFARTIRVPKPQPFQLFTHAAADREAKKRWGYRGVAVIGQRHMVGYFEDRTPDDPSPHPPYPWVTCGEGATWAEAFEASADIYL